MRPAVPFHVRGTRLRRLHQQLLRKHARRLLQRDSRVSRGQLDACTARLLCTAPASAPSTSSTPASTSSTTQPTTASSSAASAAEPTLHTTETTKATAPVTVTAVGC